MRGAALVLTAVLATTAACSPKAPAPPPAPAAAAPAAPPAPAAPETAAAAAPAPQAAAAPAAPAPPQTVRFSPADYGAHERRVAALINNAESRDTTGETQALARQARAQRQRCTTRACIEQSYAAEESRLRKWEGSSDIR